MIHSESDHYKWHSAQESEAKRLCNISVPQVIFGYWRGQDQRSFKYPMPEADSAVDLDAELYKTLVDIEKYATIIGFRGFSKCRICGCMNGSQEYIFQPLPDGTVYRWPKGLLHYFEAHKVAAQEGLRLLCNDYLKALASGARFTKRETCPPLEMEQP